jgi:hypothetical protein
MIADFAAAVAATAAAVERFDAPKPNDDCDEREPIRLDWNAIREPAVLAEEAALERDFGCGTRSAGGGGEQRGCDDGRSATLPLGSFLPQRARVRDALRSLGTATTSEIAQAAGSGHYTATCLVKMLSRGEVRRDDGKMKRWTWIGPGSLPAADRELVDEARDLMAGGMTLRKVCERFRAERRKLAGREVTPAWLMRAMRTNGERLAEIADAAPAGVSNAADEPQEVKKMPRGKRIEDAQVLAVLSLDEWRGADHVAKGVGCTTIAACRLLKRMAAKGLVKSDGKRPAGWIFVSHAHPGKQPSPKKAKRSAAPASGTIASLLEREIDRQASLRAAAILRAHADAIEAEAGSAA